MPWASSSAARPAFLLMATISAQEIGFVNRFTKPVSSISFYFQMRRALPKRTRQGGNMPATRRVLIAGESWTVHSTHQKGFDSFSTVEYGEGIRWLRDALETGGWQVDYQPAHVAARDFPFD